MTSNQNPICNFTSKLPPMSKIKNMKLLNSSEIKSENSLQNPLKQQIKDTKQKKQEKKKKKRRCELEGCKKKLSLIELECKCGKKFCRQHMQLEKHNCTFDVKKHYKENLIKELGGGEIDKVLDRM